MSEKPLTVVAEKEILEEAQKIKDRNYREAEAKKESDLVEVMQSLTGKFFKTLEFNDEKKEFYRIFYDSWRDNQIKVETWKYYHDEYYSVEIGTWYGDKRALYDEEITEVEFMQAVSWWMKKVGVHQILRCCYLLGGNVECY